MIGRVYRLIDTKRIEMKQREIITDTNTVLIRPYYMAICAADMRYYLGQRKKMVLANKLPMALIHEATGRVIKDFSGRFKNGENVVLIPLDEGGGTDDIKGNYREGAAFASSGVDGFMRDIIAISNDRLLPLTGGDLSIYVFTEVLSVALGAIKAFEAVRRTAGTNIGVWGDGSMGFVTALALCCKYPESKIYVFGKSVRKLSKFSFAAKLYYIDDVPKGLRVNHAFECVGGRKSEEAIAQIIDMITPQGVVNLLGVSENTISIDTRRALDKGLTFMANSRSDKADFEEALSLIKDNEMCGRYLKLLISETIEIETEDDITKWFEHDILNDFKTVGVWRI